MSFARSFPVRWHLVATAIPAVLVGSFAPAAIAQQDCIFPPNPTPVVVVQKDGAEISLRLRADSDARWYEDQAGYPVVESAAGFVYARVGPDGGLVPTESLVGRADPARAGLRARVDPRGSAISVGAKPGAGP